MSGKHERTHGEDGAALISALVIVAVMSFAALSVIDVLRFSVRVSTNLESREQARLYALGAEELAAATLKSTWRSGSGRNPMLDQWVQEPVVFPVDGGVIEVDARDGANCFNLNAVVQGDGAGNYIAAPQNADLFSALLEALGTPAGDAAALTGALIDWIDADSTPTAGGAEDYYYAALQTPYRTSGQLLADPSELRTIMGFTRPMVDALGPYVCARPDVELAPLNVNSISNEESALMAAYLGRAYDLNDAFQLIGERPVGGYADMEEFFAHPIFGDGASISDERRRLFSLSSRTYSISAEIRRHDVTLSMWSTLQMTDSGDITTVSRRFGSPL